MKGTSLQNRLIASVLGVTVIIYLVLALALYEFLDFNAMNQLRQMLEHQHELVKGLLEEEEADGEDRMIIELELHGIRSGDFVDLYSGRYYIVLVPNQEPILSASLGGKIPEFMKKIEPDPKRQMYLLAGPQQEKLMVLSQTVSFAGRDIQVAVAESLAETQAWLHHIRIALWLLIPVTLLVLMLLTSWVVRKALKPLYSLIQDIETFDFQKSSGLSEQSQRPVSELEQLSGAFNQLIQRINQVRQAEEQLLIDVSHQLKTPVTVILSTCDVILQRERSIEKYQSSLKQIRETGRSMRTLVTRLLSAAHLAAEGRRTLNLAQISLEQVALDALRMMEPLAIQKEIAISYRAEDAPEVMGDSVRLIELVIILLENAIHYSPSGTTVHLSLEGNQHSAHLTVQDQGPGISPQDLPQIFMRFFRGTAGEGREGSGLGLTIAQQITQLHHGELQASSQLGQGSCFKLSLPARPL